MFCKQISTVTKYIPNMPPPLSTHLAFNALFFEQNAKFKHNLGEKWEKKKKFGIFFD